MRFHTYLTASSLLLFACRFDLPSGSPADAALALTQQAYIKASNTDGGDFFGYGLALSRDGSTLAVGARNEASASRGVGGVQGDNSNIGAGAVYVFRRSSSTWSQQAYLKASNTDPGDSFGNSLALSDDGTTLVVGAPREASAATGIDGNQDDDSAIDAGAVYVFTSTDGAWNQQAYLKASNTDAGDGFGQAVALSGDGTVLATSAIGEASASTGLNGNQGDNSSTNAGAVYLFVRAGGSWLQQAYVKASNTGAGDFFGHALALSGDGSVLAVTAPTEDSMATGINGNQADNSTVSAGAIYVFTRNGTTWSQQAYIKASNSNAGDYFGISVTLSADGMTMAAGADGEDSGATGIDGNQADNSASNGGAAYVFIRNGTTWIQQSYIKASNPGIDDEFGDSISLSANGLTLAVSAGYEDSAGIGIDSNQADGTALDAGAVYLLTRTSTGWSQQAYIKASNTGAGDYFGWNVTLSADASVMAVGAYNEDSVATGIDGNQADNFASNAGAVYVYQQ